MRVGFKKLRRVRLGLCLLLTASWIAGVCRILAADSKQEVKLSATQAPTASPPKNIKHVDFKFPAEGSLSIIVVQSPDKQSATKVTEQTRRFFKAKDFDGLEELGNRLCREKSDYLNGDWQSSTFFDALMYGLYEDYTTEDDWWKNLQVLQEWEKQKPKSVHAKTSLIRYWRCYAFRGRNDTDGKEMTSGEHHAFHQRLNLARELMPSADSLPEICPVLLREEMMVESYAHEHARSAVKKLSVKSLKDFPTYLENYTETYSTLRPSWWGKRGDCEKFLAEQSDMHGKGKESDKFYARLVWNMADNEQLYSDTFFHTKISWPRIKSGFEQMLKENPESLTILSEFALIADLANDKATARELFKRLGNRCDASVFSWGQGFHKYRFDEYRTHVLSDKKYTDTAKTKE